MLIAFASLLAAGALQAQPAPAEAMQPMAPAAPVAETPVAEPVAPAVPAEPAPPPPTLPTTGNGALLLSIVEKICIPAVRGQAFETTAPAMGFKKNRRDNTWAMQLGADKNHQIILLPQGSNEDVCQAEVRYPMGQEAPFVEALNIWSFLHEPELKLGANYVNVDPDGIKRVRKSWENFDQTSSTAINFSTLTKPDGSPLNARYATGMLFYQERKF